MFFSHMAGSLSTSVQVVSGHVVCVRFSFCFAMHPPLPDMFHPLIQEVCLECIK